jgi:RNA polymerase sigma-70 factor (ECF subfamily)
MIRRELERMQEQLPYLTALARRLTGNAHDASDLVQDALVRALRAEPPLPARDELRPWLATIVRHLHVDRLRQLAREPKQLSLDDAGPLRATDADEPALAEAVEHEQLARALAELPDDFRRVFVLHELDGRSYRDIAAELGIPVATVGTRLCRARLKLRELLRARTSPR